MFKPTATSYKAGLFWRMLFMMWKLNTNF